MVEEFFLASPWPGMIFWCILYISDYALTLNCARLYRSAVADKLVFEGSYELTPFYQADIDALRPVSPRFVIVLLVYATVLAGVWWLCKDEYTGLYQLTLGVMVLPQLAVHVRHLRNLFQFLDIARRQEAVQGRIAYSRQFVLQVSSVELFSFAGLYAVLSVYFLDWFMLGGTVACFAYARNHRNLARKSAAGAPARSVKPEAPSSAGS